MRKSNIDDVIIKFKDINQALRFLLQKEEKSKAQMERSKIGFIQES